MTQNNIIPLFPFGVIPDAAYDQYLSSMDKLELLEEMVNYQTRRSELGILTPELQSRGIPLFTRLAASAETHELKTLAQGYLTHLKSY